MTIRALSDIHPPFYLCSLPGLEEKYRSFEQALSSRFQQFAIGYSYKTNYIPFLCRRLHQLGAWAEVVSPLEYQLARALGVPGQHIVYNGPHKSEQSLATALGNGSLINLDSMQEVNAVARLARSFPGYGIGLRVNLPVQDGKRQGFPSRFGLRMEELTEASRILKNAGMRISGLHAHLSSKKRDRNIFHLIASVLLQAIRQVDERELDYLDIGGGFGYAPSSMPDLKFPSFAEYAEELISSLSSWPRLQQARLIAEPGMALVGECMSFFAPVVSLKQFGDLRIAVVDGSIHNVKPTRHGMNLPAAALNRDFSPKEGASISYDIAGYTCMEDDFPGINMRLPELGIGDVVRFDNVGAYTLVFKPPFIRATPPVYAFDGEEYTMIKSEESFEDIFRGYKIEM